MKGQELPRARWSLGRWGLPINAFAVSYSAFIVLLSCFPDSNPTDISDANMAPVIWTAVILITVVAYVVHGRKNFTPPVMFIEGQRSEFVVAQVVS